MSDTRVRKDKGFRTIYSTRDDDSLTHVQKRSMTDYQGHLLENGKIL
jgi:hypothetical protein